MTSNEIQIPTCSQIIKRLKWWNRAYIYICRYVLGVNIFKKIWPVQGSLWNKEHTSRSNSEHLKIIIDDSWGFTQVHIGSLFAETLLFLVGSWSGFFPKRAFKGYLPVAFVLHIYPLLVHRYNRLLAHAHLDYLKEKDLLVTELSMEQFDKQKTHINYLTVQRSYYYNYRAKEKKHTTWEVCDSENQFRVGPYFLSEEKAKEFANFITTNWWDHQSFYTEFHLCKKNFYKRFRDTSLWSAN